MKCKECGKNVKMEKIVLVQHPNREIRETCIDCIRNRHKKPLVGKERIKWERGLKTLERKLGEAEKENDGQFINWLKLEIRIKKERLEIE